MKTTFLLLAPLIGFVVIFASASGAILLVLRRAAPPRLQPLPRVDDGLRAAQVQLATVMARATPAPAVPEPAMLPARSEEPPVAEPSPATLDPARAPTVERRHADVSCAEVWRALVSHALVARTLVRCLAESHLHGGHPVRAFAAPSRIVRRRWLSHHRAG